MSNCSAPEDGWYYSLPYVILSERSESKDLRTVVVFAVNSVRRSFDSGLRPPLRMTNFRDFKNN